MSLRAIAKELEISPAYLSYMINGKRPWRKDLHQRYMGVVNTFVNSGEDCTSVQESEFAELDTKNGVPGRIRTRDPLLRRQPLYPLSYWDGSGDTFGWRLPQLAVHIADYPDSGC